jgi:hypothetical protein
METYKCKLSTLKSANESSKQTIDSLHTKSLSLSVALKNEKKKSRTAMEQLLIVTTRQTEELISTFQDRLEQLKIDHKTAVGKLMHDRNQDRLDYQSLLSN